MQRIDVQSASPTLPAPIATGTPGYFTEGNALTGVEATVVTADFLNMVQEELIAVVLAGGGAPSKQDRAQLLAAIVSLILGGSESSIGPEGSVSLGGGLLVLKWGTATVPIASAATNSVSHAFPDPFPTGCFGVFGLPTKATAPTGWNPIGSFVPSSDKNGFIVVIDSTDPARYILQPVPFFYVAIGN